MYISIKLKPQPQRVGYYQHRYAHTYTDDKYKLQVKGLFVIAPLPHVYYHSKLHHWSFSTSRVLTPYTYQQRLKDPNTLFMTNLLTRISNAWLLWLCMTLIAKWEKIGMAKCLIVNSDARLSEYAPKYFIIFENHLP